MTTSDIGAEPPVPLRTWIAVGGALLGAFMAVLNIQITNASLPYIEGGIGTGGVNGTWISTAYLIGEIIVIPLSDFLSRAFSLRRYLIVNTALFLVFSMACGQASSLGEMIVLRGLQGFAGGVLIPLAFTIIVTMLPPSKRAMGMAGFAVSATFAPAIGPTVGGYFTENYGWPYVFYINIGPGIVMLAALWYALPKAPMRLDLLPKGDWLVVLEFRRSNPLIKFQLLGRRNFGLGTLSNFMLGFALYGSAYLLPDYLSESQGYNSEQVGAVMAWTGFPQLALIPFVPLLMKRIDSRLLVAAGLLVFAASCFMNLTINHDYAGPELFWPDVIRALGQALVITPLASIAMTGIAPADAGAASGLFNMTRNLGGAIGVAALETFISKREQYHSDVINSGVSLLDEATRQRLMILQRHFITHGIPDAAAAMHQSMVAVGETIRAQALLMGYGDAFGLLGVILVLAAGSVALLRRGSATGGGAH